MSAYEDELQVVARANAALHAAWRELEGVGDDRLGQIRVKIDMIANELETWLADLIKSGE